MPGTFDKQAVIFGGFRTETLEESRAATTFLDALGIDQPKTHTNVWKGTADSLRERYIRSALWLETIATSGKELHILGYSMGCQLAVRFAQSALEQGQANSLLGSLTLVAPDPKHRRGCQDLAEQRQGIVSAYDEACQLWPLSNSSSHFGDLGWILASTKRSFSDSRYGCEFLMI